MSQQWMMPAGVKRHCCADYATTTAGDGVTRCLECYEKEARRGRSCGEMWPSAFEAFGAIGRRPVDLFVGDEFCESLSPILRAVLS